jgi:Protein of unknown function (DUF4058)
MTSPFPGMDPYIEACRLFEDFHNKLISEIERFLSGRLPERYVVRTPERSYVALSGLVAEDARRSVVADVAITSTGRAKKTRQKPKESTRSAWVPGAVAPVLLPAMLKEEHREPFIEIRQPGPEHKLVTGIEVLSPSNKRPNTKGRRLYYRKRLQFLRGYAHLVEIDLLRHGRRMPMAAPWPDSPYYLMVCRKKHASRCEVYPASFTEPLPPIPIPLNSPDPDIMLNIQPFIEAIYTRSRYAGDINYRRPLDPPLNAVQAGWLEKRLRERH